ncbi:MAG: S41 family peptidase [Crocinitomicaceae bacterium]|nr:S41 family peptidase [Crocinitomicaceae bacterium]
MKRNLRLILFFSVAAILMSSMYVTTVSKQQEDYNVFSTVLTQKEGVIDLHSDKDSIQYYLKDLKSKLNSEKSLLEQFKLYSIVIEKLHGGHTKIMANNKVKTEWLRERNSLPFDMYLIGRHLVVGELADEDQEALDEKGAGPYWMEPGSEIISIDDRTVPEMMLEMGKYISSDEGSMDFKYYQASQMFDFYRHLALPFDKDSIPVKFISLQNDTIEAVYKTGSAPVHSMNNRLVMLSGEYYASEQNHGKFKILRNKYGYFRFKSFTSSNGADYEYFLEQAFKKLSERKINKLVVDLRGNTGGVMQYSFMKYLVGKGVNLGKYIIEKPNTRKNRKYVNKINIHYLRHTLMSYQQKKKMERGSFNEGIQETESLDTNLIYKGKIVVITDEGTFSSAAILACHLKTLSKAKIIGRPAGGSFYAGNAGTLLVKLPQSGFLIAINPNTFYSHLEREGDPGAIKQPDLYLSPLIIESSDRDQFYFKKAISLFE